jgi:hypothetical protein
MSAEKHETIECTLPIGSVHNSSLQILPPREYGEKILFPLRYEDPLFSAHNVTLLLPPLKLKGYSSTTQLLEVYADPILSKLQTIQDALLIQLTQQRGWLTTASLKTPEIQHLFQPILKSNVLTVFLHPKTWIWKSGTWTQGPATEFSAGSTLQLVLRLQGLQVLPPTNPGKRIRIQHQTLGVLCA